VVRLSAETASPSKVRTRLSTSARRWSRSAGRPPVERETFAPILYVIKYSDFDAVLELHNAIPQGLSFSIFTNDLREAEGFLSVRGSDAGSPT
jgi:acyl-CoA reductase-like NAD-dependent aldehyde dehydrogenase